MLVASPLAADETPLPPAPAGYVEFVWSAQLASVLVNMCSDFALKEWDPRVVAFMDALVADGVDLANSETVYAPPPDFDGASGKFLIERSNIADGELSSNFEGCDLAELVFGSDMLAAAMLTRVATNPGS